MRFLYRLMRAFGNSPFVSSKRAILIKLGFKQRVYPVK